MELKCKINGEEVTLRAEPTARLRDVLYRAGYRSVRDSDDAEGFAGSDTIVFNGKLKYANFILFYQAEGAEIRTAESLLNGRELNNVQKAMVAAGIVQSAYNAPAAALILTWLLEQKPNPTREEIKDVLTSIFIRDAGYEHYYLAVKLATELRDFGEFRSEIAPSFRPSLEVVGKPCGKIDGAALVSGEPVFVEDKVPENAWCLHVLRSPFASAYIKSINTSEAEKLPGVAAILTAYNTPETHYMQAGQGNPEPSPHDRRLFNRKVRHVGDRVAGIIAHTPEIADQAAALIKVEYEPQGAVYTVEEAMAEGAPLVHNGEVIYNAGAPADLAEYNKLAGDEREGKVVYQFPLGADIHKNIAASNKGGIGDMEKGFAEADAIVERTYQTSQIQHTPLEPHVCYAHIEGGRLVLNCATQVPYHVRRIVSWVCGIPENKIHVIKERVGGGYGSKQDILVEDLTGYAAWVTGKPVYYRNTRAEEFYANSTRHPMRVKVKMGGKKDGTITALDATVGAVCSGTVATIQDVDNLTVEVTIPASSVGRLKTGLQCNITSDATDDTITGTLTRIDPVANDSGSFGATVTVNGQDSGLLVGIPAKVEIVISTKDNVFTVPRDAVGTNDDGSTYVLRKTGGEGVDMTFEQVAVTEGDTNDYYVEITGSDLNEGDVIRATADLTQGIESGTSDSDVQMMENGDLYVGDGSNMPEGTVVMGGPGGGPGGPGGQ